MSEARILPKGRIDLRSLVEAIMRARFGEPKEIPWVERGPGVLALDPEKLTEARHHARQAENELLASLIAGRLLAEVDDLAIMPAYWNDHGTIETLQSGRLVVQDGHPPELKRHRNEMPTVDLDAARAWLRKVFGRDLLAEILPAETAPKPKGGNRRAFNDDKIVEKAREIIDGGVVSKEEAVRRAMKQFPELVHGRGAEPSIRKRIVRNLDRDLSGQSR